MPRTIEKTVFTFDELDERAKEKARDWWRQDGLEYEWYDCTFDDAKRCGALLGIEIDRIFFSGFASQGDGACFEGTYEYRKGWRKALRAEIGGEDLKTVEAIGDALQDIQRRRFYGISASCRQSGHYMHSGCMAVSVDIDEHPAGGYWDDISDDQDAVTDELRLFAGWIYTSLEREYDYLMSDESVDDMLECNEYEFDENGELA